jgi:hypothetical protein
LLAVPVLIISLFEATERNAVPPDGFFRSMILGKASTFVLLLEARAYGLILLHNFIEPLKLESLPHIWSEVALIMPRVELRGAMKLLA